MSFDVKNACILAKQSSIKLAATTTACRNDMLRVMANALITCESYVLEQNAEDIIVAKQCGRTDAFLDRLALDSSRIKAMAEGMLQVIALPDPVGEVLDCYTLENGLQITKIRVPFGVIGIIYEARPNVTADAISLCIKSGNAVVLKGSKEAHQSNKAIYSVFTKALMEHGYDSGAIQFIDDKDREATTVMLSQGDSIDVVIPRGSDNLKHFVMQNAAMPVLASAGGNCHCYVESSADLNKALAILLNAKIQRPSVCNACEQLLVDEAIANEFLPLALSELDKNGVKIYGDQRVKACYCNVIDACEQDYYTERSALAITVYIVKNYSEAIDRVNKYGTKHSECIVSSNDEAIKAFTSLVDCACCYANASTRFTDGFQFGLGAEMAISTGKLHARGPIGLKELTSIKYICIGNGQVRK